MIKSIISHTQKMYVFHLDLLPLIFRKRARETESEIERSVGVKAKDVGVPWARPTDRYTMRTQFLLQGRGPGEGMQ